jgi:hypothetical protein
VGAAGVPTISADSPVALNRSTGTTV